MKMTTDIDAEMQRGIDDGVFPAAELLVGAPQEIRYHKRFGACQSNSLFDIASLTKVVNTTTLCMMAVAERKLAVTDFLSQRTSIPQHPSHDPIQLYHLLQHSSGLPAYRRYYLELPVDDVATPAGKEWIIHACSKEPCEQPVGERVVYSDVGFILLGRVLEEVYSEDLDVLFHQRIAKPLGLTNTSFHPTPEICLPSEDSPWRHRVVWGECRDENCYAMGGVAGHAGLFGNAEDLHRFASALVKAHAGNKDFLNPEVVSAFLHPTTPPPHQPTRRVLGWDAPDSKNSSAGSHFSPTTIGHLGHTGCSLWVDLERSLWVILLTNRTYPNVENDKIRSFRPIIHDLVLTHL
ncbi:MAG: hypothetical protein COV45_00980 [Deltaproteobacteria bacterium CG11_big_fil_rev_8_21_14_0_20_47_16]|nr:MAG: hypothetical protein COV45_00980 [Deltaproteobacteria bacterium CG11_big_fil_rev_8_21_14_0_20_47_16]